MSEKIDPQISVVSAYYDNAEMLQKQYQWFQSYCSEIRDKIEFVLVDDASPRFPAKYIAPPDFGVQHRIFRIKKDIPWNQDCARNIGAHNANGDWLLLTDIDHLVPEDTLRYLLSVTDRSKIYTFARNKYPSMSPYHYHVNSFFMTKQMYWSIGGYDEDYRGIYGTDGYFIRRAFEISERVHLEEAFLSLVSDNIIEDANTRLLSRKNSLYKKIRRRFIRNMKTLGLMPKLSTMKSDYEQVL